MSESNSEIPQEFYKVSKDFITDILTTFPEYKATLHEGLNDVLQGTMIPQRLEKFSIMLKKFILRDFLIYFTKMKIFLPMKILTQNSYQILNLLNYGNKIFQTKQN